MTEDSQIDAVRRYYAQFGEREWQRLASPDDGQIEFALTCRALAKYLPKTGRILDIGGGPGRYAIWLAKRGYKVVLADLSSNLLDIAKVKIAESGVEPNIESITVADARDLADWDANSFDAILSLGPFYHLPALEDREKAASELVRVLRPSALAFVALMTKYTLLRRTMLIPEERQHLMNADWLHDLMETGNFQNDQPGRFNSGFGVNSIDVKPFFERFGLEAVDLLGTESLSIGLRGGLADVATTEPDMYAKMLDLLEDAASDPSIHGMCSHLLYIGRKSIR